MQRYQEVMRLGMQRQLFRASLLSLATVSTTAALMSAAAQANVPGNVPGNSDDDGASPAKASAVDTDAASGAAASASSVETPAPSSVSPSPNPDPSFSSAPVSPRFSHPLPQQDSQRKTAPAKDNASPSRSSIQSHLTEQRAASAAEKPDQTMSRPSVRGQSNQRIRQVDNARITPNIASRHDVGLQPQPIIPPGIVPTLPLTEFDATTNSLPAEGTLADGAPAALPPEPMRPTEPAWADREAPELALGNAIAPENPAENQADFLAENQPEIQPEIQSEIQPEIQSENNNGEAVVNESASLASDLPPASMQYQVQPGDTLNAIARRLGVPVQALILANHIDNPNQLRSGLTLTLPAATPTGEGVDATSVAPNQLARLQAGVTAPIDRMALMNRLRPTASQTNPEWVSPQASSVATEASPIDASVANASTVAIAIPVIPAQNLPEISAPEGLEPSGPEPSGPELLASAPMVNASPVSEAAPTDSYATELLTQVTVAQSRYAPLNVPSTPFVATDLPPVATATPSYSAGTYSAGSSANHASSRRSSPSTAYVAPTHSSNYSSNYSTSDYSSTVAVRPSTVDPITPELPGADRYLPQISGEYNGYIWPTQGTFTSGYGPRWGRMHRGIDIAAPIGTPVVSAAPGVVEFAGWTDGGFGNLVDIRHPDGSMTRYAHNDRVLVRTGQYVSQGQLISEMGTTGRSTGPHLHFEIHRPDQGTVNPMSMLPQQVAGVQF
jgi:murein DD-endopeptidase MepM/ murein hydrolase activator NlpD